MRNVRIGIVPLLAAGLVMLAGCADEFMIPDLNNPGLESLEESPTRAAIIDATQGLLIGARNGHTGQISTRSHLGILGRESLVFDPSDPRYMDEMLAGNLNPGNGAFGGFGWAPRYSNLRNASIVLNAVDALEGGFSAGEEASVRGFVKTIMALDLYWVVTLRDANGAVVDVNRPFADGPGPFVTKDAALDHIEGLLDEAAGDLGGGAAFPFQLTSGFDGFNTPAGMVQFNRALKARINVLRGDYGSALNDLGGTWVSQGAGMNVGVFHTFSTASGDVSNGLFQGADPQIVAHPSLRDIAEAGDARLAAKTATLDAALSGQGVSSDLRFIHYPTLSSPLPIIRNEELLLLRAEARWFTGDPGGAMEDLNHVRTTSGGLDELDQPASDAEFIDMLTYERLFSLLFEGGHRWIDARRFGFTGDLPRDRSGDAVPTAFPIPRNECLARNLSTPCGV